MGIHIQCGKITYRESYTGFTVLCRIACSATVLYLLDLANKPPVERGQQICSVTGIDDIEELDEKTTKLIYNGIESTEAMIKNGYVNNDAAAEFLWRRHQTFAYIGLSGLVDLVFHADTEGYYTEGMAVDILAWWARVGPFYPQAVGQYVAKIPSDNEVQAGINSITKRLRTGVQVTVKITRGPEAEAFRNNRMDELIAVLREVVRTGTFAHVG